MKMAMKAVREQGTTQMEEELKVLREKLQQERVRHLVSKEFSQRCLQLLPFFSSYVNIRLNSQISRIVFLSRLLISFSGRNRET